MKPIPASATFPTVNVFEQLDPYPGGAKSIEDPVTQLSNRTDYLLALQALNPFRCWVIASFNIDLTVQYRAEIWNLDGTQAHPVLARTSTGLYTLTFAAHYLDKDGVEVPTVLRFARATGMTDPDVTPQLAFAFIDSINPLQVNIKTFNTAYELEDHPFMVEVA